MLQFTDVLKRINAYCVYFKVSYDQKCKYLLKTSIKNNRVTCALHEIQIIIFFTQLTIP